jgi:monoamine oxidase
MPGTGDPIQRMLRARAAELRGEVDEPQPPEAGGTTRRMFLGRAAAVGAGALLAGPVSGAFAASRRERRAQARQQARTGARVVVIGAGLAGVTCAYRLNQAGVKAQVYEARDGRLGGRCWTVRGFQHGQVGEHGGEFIDTRHVHILRIVDELGLELEDRAKAARQHPNLTRPLWLNGELQDRAAISAGFDDLFAKLKADYKRVGDYHYNRASDAAREFDQMTALDWLNANVDDPLLREVVDIGQSGFFGIDASRMSAINLFEAYVAPYPGANERYHTKGGNDQIPHGMAQTLDEGQVHFNAPLQAMWRRSDGSYNLSIGGISSPVAADRVVLCLPFTTLRDVDLDASGLSAKRRASIDELAMGTNAKNHVQLAVRPWKLDRWGGGMTMDEPFRQSSWESTEGQEGKTSVITIWRGGQSGASYPTDVPHQWAPPPIVNANLAAFERGVPGITAAYNGRAWLDSWVDDPWVKGSYAGFYPGQYTKYWGYLSKQEGGVHFAGEHTSTHSQGYLNGGVESGDRAAREVLRALA